jgi:regulator of sigma E protease
VSVLYFLLLVGVLVVIHEFGHFLAAKLLDFKVTRFSVGFGRPLVRFHGRETEYQIALFPLGGYVRILGEEPGDEVSPEDAGRSFSARPLWQRLVVVFAGPAANLALPVVIYFAFFAGHTELPAAVIGDVLPGTPAERAGLEPGDRVVSVNGEKVRYWEDVESLIRDSAGRELRFRVRRGERELERYIVPIDHTRRSRDGRKVRSGLVGIARDPFLPQIGVVDPASPAARAGLATGDIIISVDGREVGSFGELRRELASASSRLGVGYARRRPVPALPHVHILDPKFADVVPDTEVDARGRGRAVHGIASAELFVDHVEPGSPAAAAGLRRGDLITALDGDPVTHWFELDQRLQSRPDHAWTIGWIRAVGGALEPMEARLTQARLQSRDEFGHSSELLVFGAQSDFQRGEGEMVPIQGRIGYAATRAVERTGETIGVMASGMWAVLRGRAPGDEIGGPIMMFRVAAVSGRKGWEAFLLMIALVSVSVGLINLLPVPLLDGGHVLVFAVEAVRRRPLSPRARDRIMLAGLAVVGLITVLAVKNDVIRYLL